MRRRAGNGQGVELKEKIRVAVAFVASTISPRCIFI